MAYYVDENGNPKKVFSVVKNTFKAGVLTANENGAYLPSSYGLDAFTLVYLNAPETPIEAMRYIAGDSSVTYWAFGENVTDIAMNFQQFSNLETIYIQNTDRMVNIVNNAWDGTKVLTIGKILVAGSLLSQYQSAHPTWNFVSWTYSNTFEIPYIAGETSTTLTLEYLQWVLRMMAGNPNEVTKIVVPSYFTNYDGGTLDFIFDSFPSMLEIESPWLNGTIANGLEFEIPYLSGTTSTTLTASHVQSTINADPSALAYVNNKVIVPSYFTSLENGNGGLVANFPNVTKFAFNGLASFNYANFGYGEDSIELELPNATSVNRFGANPSSGAGGDRNIKSVSLVAPRAEIEKWMFYNCSSLESVSAITISENAVNVGAMFMSCPSLRSLPAEIPTANATDLSSMFNGCSALESIPQMDTSKATSLRTAFQDCRSLTSVPSLDTRRVTNFMWAFGNCVSLQSLPAFDLSQATNTYGMFEGCAELTSVSLNNANNMTDVRAMFGGCRSLRAINGTLNLNGVTSNANQLFQNCVSLQSVRITNIKVNLDVSQTALGHDNLVDIIDNLVDVGASRTFTIGSAKLALLSSAEIAVATNKGWTLA